MQKKAKEMRGGKASAHGRRMYRFEGSLPKNRKLHNELPIKKLRELAYQVAADYDREPPKVVAGNGVPSADGSTLCSYSAGPRIELARHHRCKLILLHELAHWLSGRDKIIHGPAFSERYFELVEKYIGFNMNEHFEEFLNANRNTR